MARDHARIWVAIWRDRDFRSLSRDEQWTYLMLCSNGDLSYCGVVDYVPERFTDLAKDMSVRRFKADLDGLRLKRFVLVDERTRELLVRSYVRHDGILKQPNVSKAMVRALQRVHSEQLRDTVIKELGRAKAEDPDAKGWRGVDQESHDLYGDICRRALQNGFANPSPNPFRKGSDNG